jgi:hypothetical protein
MLKSLMAIGIAGLLSVPSMMNLTGCSKRGEGNSETGSVSDRGAQDAAISAPVNRAPTVARGSLPVIVEPTSIDLGIVSPGSTVSGSAMIKNVGGESLRILTSKSSCQCTVVDLANTVIDPNQTIEVPAQFDPGTQFGKRTATITLVFEGYDDLVEISLSAEVAFAVRTVPSIITRQIPYTQRFTDKPTYLVEALDGRPFHVLRVQDEAPTFVDFDPETDEARNAYKLYFDFKRYDSQLCIDEQGRPMPSYLAIETDHPGCPILDVRLKHNCTAHEVPVQGQNWVLADRRALLGLMEPGSSKEFDVPLRWARDTEAIHVIDSVVSESPQFFAELVDVYEKHDTFWYRVRITPTGHHRGLLYGTVRFRSLQHDMAMTVIGRVIDSEDDDG